jgi:hypothetical protein
MEIMYKILAFKNAVIKFAVTCKFETVQIDILRTCLIITELETISFLDFTHVSRFSDTFFFLLELSPDGIKTWQLLAKA